MLGLTLSSMSDASTSVVPDGPRRGSIASARHATAMGLIHKVTALVMTALVTVFLLIVVAVLAGPVLVLVFAVGAAAAVADDVRRA